MRRYKIVIILLWVILTTVLISRDLFIPELSHNQSPLLKNGIEEHYFGIWFQEKRIGFVSEKVVTDGNNKIILHQKAFMNLAVLQTKQTINMELHATLNNKLQLNDFQFKFQSPFYQMKANGTVNDKTVNFSLDTGRTTIKDQLELSRPPILEMNDRGYLLKELTEIGDKAKISSFDPVSLTGRDITVEYLGKEKILIQGRIHNLYGFAKSFSGIRIKFWINDQGKVIKEQSAAGFTFLAEPKFKAMNIDDTGSDLLSSVAVKYTGELPGQRQQTVNYRLTYPSDVQLDLDGGRQTNKNNIVTVSQEIIPSSTDIQPSSFCDNKKSLQASIYVQSDHPDIKSMAAKIIGDEQNKIKQIQLLSSWIFTNLEKRPVIGLPDALTTMMNKKGDCNEHAALFAALARSIGVPTRIATGVTLFRGAFYYHAWNEICINAQWLSLDTTTNQIPADLTHIRFAIGDMAQQIKIGALLGKLSIEIINPSNSKSTEQ